jgi:hypothetical protein
LYGIFSAKRVKNEVDVGMKLVLVMKLMLVMKLVLE